jgi:hypothetical protein
MRAISVLFDSGLMFTRVTTAVFTWFATPITVTVPKLQWVSYTWGGLPIPQITSQTVVTFIGSPLELLFGPLLILSLGIFIFRLINPIK